MSMLCTDDQADPDPKADRGVKHAAPWAILNPLTAQIRSIAKTEKPRRIPGNCRFSANLWAQTLIIDFEKGRRTHAAANAHGNDRVAR